MRMLDDQLFLVSYAFSFTSTLDELELEKYERAKTTCVACA